MRAPTARHYRECLNNFTHEARMARQSDVAHNKTYLPADEKSLLDRRLINRDVCNASRT